MYHDPTTGARRFNYSCVASPSSERLYSVIMHIRRLPIPGYGWTGDLVDMYLVRIVATKSISTGSRFLDRESSGRGVVSVHQ
jgi:hypothetical protein